MPIKKIDYSKTIIYKLCCMDLSITDIYIGHTTNFDKRKCQHKSQCNNPNSKSINLKVYKFIKDNGGWDNWDMILVETYPCSTSADARFRERHWMETLKSSLNCRSPLKKQNPITEACLIYASNKLVLGKEKFFEKLEKKKLRESKKKEKRLIAYAKKYIPDFTIELESTT